MFCPLKSAAPILINILIHICREVDEGRPIKCRDTKFSITFCLSCTLASSGTGCRHFAMSFLGPGYITTTLAGAKTAVTRICLKAAFKSCCFETNLICQSFTATVPTPWPKKGRRNWLLRTQASERFKRANHSGQ